MMGRNRIWCCAVMVFMAIMAAVPAYGEVETEQPQEDVIEDTGNPKYYDGIVTDEMIDGWECGAVDSTDPYGNELDWDMDKRGNEEGAGDECETDRMEGPTYEAKEQEEILEKGWLSVKGSLGNEWPGYNVTVAFYDENHKRMEITVYSQNDFEIKKKVPEGIYKVYRAYVPGDENGGKYPLVVSESAIEVEEGKTAELTVWRAVDLKGKEEPEKQGSPSELESISSPSGSSDILAAVSIGAGGLIFFVMGFVVYKRKMTHDRY